MKQTKIFKALANDARLQILEWLKEPKKHFATLLHHDKTHCDDAESLGICVGLIHKKSGLSQSTVSQYLTILQDAGLLTVTRVGQWTYYKRNEKVIADVARYVAKEL